VQEQIPLDRGNHRQITGLAKLRGDLLRLT
jgi:hypothetical protein